MWSTELRALTDARFQHNSSTSKPRSVFVIAKWLDQSESKSRSKARIDLMEEEAISAECFLGKQRSALTIAFEHWGLFVSHEHNLVSGRLFELRRSGKASVPHEQPGQVIREMINGKPRWNLSFRTQTSLTDKQIQELGTYTDVRLLGCTDDTTARGVITKLGEDYAATSRNCQKFTELLILCIQRAHSQDEVFLGLSELPHEHAAVILKRRCAEWIAHKADRGLSVVLHAPIKPSMTFEALLHAATPPMFLLALLIMCVDLTFHGVTWVSLLSALAIGVMLPKAEEVAYFYSAKSRAIRNRIMRRQRANIGLAELISRIDGMAVEEIDIQSVVSAVLESAIL